MFGSKIIKAVTSLFKAKEIQQYADTILRNNEGEILLLQRSYNSDLQPGKWCLPGGKLDPGENSEIAAPREVEEETGLNIQELQFIRQIVKENAIINYYQGFIAEDDPMLLLDNEEHYRYEFVPIENLDRYDLIFDLHDILQGMIETLIPMNLPVTSERKLTPEEEVPVTYEAVEKAYSSGQISEGDFTAYDSITKSMDIIVKGFNDGLVTDEKFFEAFEKSKHFEFIKVMRDGKQFFQYREVGTNKVEEELSTGDFLETGDLGLKITKYSDKSVLITGNTYQNLQLLRDIKTELGIGSWNKTLNGWIFPSSGSDKILAKMATKMPDDTAQETENKDAVIATKNALDPGDNISVAQEELAIKSVEVNEDGQVEYTTDPKEKDDEGKIVTEEDAAIPAASEEEAKELIGNATEENRVKTAKKFFGKEENEQPVGKEIEKNGEKDIKIQLKEFNTRSGKSVQALDYSNIQYNDIMLADVKNVLNKPRPYYIPEINEYAFSGASDDNFIFDYAKLDDNGNYLVSLNGYDRSYINYRNDPRLKNVDNAFAVMSLDVLVATTEYYKTKRKAELKKEAETNTENSKSRWEAGDDMYRNATLKYYNLSDKQKSTISELQWQTLSIEGKSAFLPDMKTKPWKEYKAGRISPIKDNKMPNSVFKLFKEFVDSAYVKPFRLTYADPCVIEFQEGRKSVEYKTNDLEMQREENEGSFTKGRETSYGNSGTKDDLLSSHGVLIKRQNGDEINSGEISQIKENLTKVYESFGDRSSMSKAFGLKISHAGNKMQHAMKAIGVYFPYYKAIGVSDAGKFGFTLAHEYAHFMDNYVGSKGGRHYASDNYQSTSGQIASLFRSNMNQHSDSKYINRSCECLARAFEQYHAFKSAGEDTPKYQNGKPYHEDPNHVSKEKFNTIIKPLIEKFFQENADVLKSAFNELNIVDINNNFEIIKSGFDSGIVPVNKFQEYTEKYNTITKGDPSHGGKLVKKQIVDKAGKKETKWVSSEDDNEPVAKTKHSHAVLSTFAQDTPASELKRVINESSDQKLRKAAHRELDRRKKKEQFQEASK